MAGYNEMSEEAKLFSQRMNARNWSVDLLHGNEVSLWRNKMPKETAPLTKKTILDKLESISKSLQSGDQFFLNIFTHGLPVKEDGHKICLGDGTDLNLNDPEIQKYLNQMKANGVEMAFLDNSCYSGESIDIFKDFGCTLSTTIDRFHAGIEIFEGQEPKNFRTGVGSILRELAADPQSKFSMEDIYLESLLNYSPHDKKYNNVMFPVLSDDLQSYDFNLLTSFAFLDAWELSGFLDQFHYESNYNLTGSFSSKAEREKVLQCMREYNFEQLSELLTNLKPITLSLKEAFPNRGVPTSYANQLIDELQNIYSKMNFHSDELKMARMGQQEMRSEVQLIDKLLEKESKDIFYVIPSTLKLTTLERENLLDLNCFPTKGDNYQCPIQYRPNNLVGNMYKSTKYPAHVFTLPYKLKQFLINKIDISTPDASSEEIQLDLVNQVESQLKESGYINRLNEIFSSYQPLIQKEKESFKRLGEFANQFIDRANQVRAILYMSENDNEKKSKPCQNFTF